MVTINSKKKAGKAVLWILAALMLIVALFLISVAIVFSVGGDAPSVFGYNIYLVKTDAFDVVSNGDAIITENVNPDEINSGNIVIFSEDDRVIIGEMQSGTLDEGIYSFSVKDENGALHTLTQSQIIGKAMYVSPILGTVVGFVSSPLGMLMIAIIPCVIIIAFEIYKLFHKDDDEPIIEPIKKQEEIPTYIPRSKSSAAETYRKNMNPEQRAVEKPNHPQGGFSATNVDDLPKYAPYKRSRQDYANDDVLFTGPQKKKQSDRREQMPLSQKKLNEAIAATKAEHELAERQKTSSASMAEAINNVQKNKQAELIRDETEVEEEGVVIASEESEPIKTYTPKPQPRFLQHNSQRMESNDNSARLDELLNDDDDNDEGFSIDDILNSLGKK